VISYIKKVEKINIRSSDLTPSLHEETTYRKMEVDDFTVVDNVSQYNMREGIRRENLIGENLSCIVFTSAMTDNDNLINILYFNDHDNYNISQLEQSSNYWVFSQGDSHSITEVYKNYLRISMDHIFTITGQNFRNGTNYSISIRNGGVLDSHLISMNRYHKTDYSLTSKRTKKPLNVIYLGDNHYILTLNISNHVDSLHLLEEDCCYLVWIESNKIYSKKFVNYVYVDLMKSISQDTTIEKYFVLLENVMSGGTYILDYRQKKFWMTDGVCNYVNKLPNSITFGFLGNREIFSEADMEIAHHMDPIVTFVRIPINSQRGII